MKGVAIPFTDREDWLEKRRTGIGASDVAGILGLSPYSTPFTVWADKVKGMEKEETEAMHFGRMLEDIVITEFQSRTGLYVGAEQMLVRHPTLEWVMATVDGLVFEAPAQDLMSDHEMRSALGNLEVKTAALFGRWPSIPDHYEIQIQWAMLVTGLDHAWVPVLHGGRQFELYETDADPGLQNMIYGKVDEFRHTYLLDPEAEPPPVDGHVATARVIADLWADPTEETIDLAAATVADIASLRAVKAEQKRLETEQKRLEARIKVSLQDATVGRADGVPIVTWKQQTVKEHVRRESTFRVLRLLKEEEVGDAW